MTAQRAGVLLGMLVMGGVLGLATESPAQRKVTVVSWGGSYQDALREVFWKPYAKETGVTVLEDTWNGELAKIRAMVETGRVTWDVVVADYEHAIAGCEQGFLAPIDPARLGPTADYLPGMIHACGVGIDVFGHIFAYNTEKIPSAWGQNRPKTIQDVWDVKKFPGKRGLRKNPKNTLEQALMADGVPGEKVYDVLSSPGGVERALAKLDAIKPHILFWSRNAQPPQLLADGEVVLTAAPNGRIDAAIREGKRFVILWDHQLYSPDTLIVVKGPNSKEAMDLVEYMTRPEVMARLTRYIAYGPSRKSAMKHVQPEILPRLPTASENLVSAVVRNEAWWADHYQEVLQKWDAWLAR
jgi:putative spermidine/putrescine transport system substrate-binding protein